MKRTRIGRWVSAAMMLALAALAASADQLAVQSFDGTGRLSYNTLNDGKSYNYRVEWASSPSGPWNEFGSAGACWLNARPQASSRTVTNAVPMFYRVVATLGDYVCIDLSGGASYSVTYYRTLADVPGGANSDTYKKTKLLLRLIPKGSFVMGSPAGELGGNAFEPEHTVTLTKDFYIGVFEVTQQQWELVMGNKPSYFNHTTYYATRPVEQVSYYDVRENPDNTAISPNWPASSQVHANSFMGKLRSKTGLTTFDLPTEAQWEYACRAGKPTAFNSGKNLTVMPGACPNMSELGRYVYNVSDTTPSQSSNLASGTAAVGTYLPNAWGLYDMHGNVWELCLDWSGDYAGNVTDPKGASTGPNRQLRSGGWSADAYDARAASRNISVVTSGRNTFVGLRACFAP